MSKIPPPKSRLVKQPTVQDENKIGLFKRPAAKVGVKRPGDAQIAQCEKKSKVGFLAKSSSENSSTLSKNAGFSLRAKRAVLQPISESNLVRGSLPAISVTGVRGKAKRPAWDLKGRIQDMEEQFLDVNKRNRALDDQLNFTTESYNQRIAALEATNTMLYKDVESKTSETVEASSQIQQLQNLLQEKSQELTKVEKEKNAKIIYLTTENNLLKEELNVLQIKHQNLNNTYTQETSTLRSTITSLTCSKAGLQAQFDASKILTQNLQEELRNMTQMKEAKFKECEHLKETTNSLEEKLLDEETVRRKLHNTIQELKGNIRVYCRVRPPLPTELTNGIKLANILMPDQKTIEIEPVTESGVNDSNNKLKKFTFSFDSIFSSSASQQGIFNEISQLVQSSIDGYNVCIFAYGQTGSGKTYTMEGPENIVDFASTENRNKLGMIPRSVLQIFECIQKLEPRGWKYHVEAFFLEIYNERIRDLVTSDASNGNMKCGIVKSAAKGGDTVLSNVMPSPVTCGEEVFNLLKKARHNRAVAATKCNEHSSRSHYVFQLKIYGENSVTGEKCDGILNLVDLAGSERVKESGSEGDRLTEAKAINKSLANLGNVIMALSKKDSHVPYRDSKLTHLLANSLGGNSKTLMFVNISPDNDNFSESVNSLRFASKVNQCNIGTAQRRIK